MPNVTGELSTFASTSLQPFSPELWFVPNTEGFTEDGKLRTSQPVKATLAADQTFTVYLAQTAAVRSAVPMYYSIEVRWLDPGNNYVRVDFFPGVKLRVPVNDSVITDILEAPILADDVWISDGGVEPPGSVSGDLIFDPITNDLLRVN